MTTSPPEAQRRWWCASATASSSASRVWGWSSRRRSPVSPGSTSSVHPEHARQWHRHCPRGGGRAARRHDRRPPPARLVACGRRHGRVRPGTRIRADRARATSSSSTRARSPHPRHRPDVELLPFTAFAADPSPIHHVDAVSVLDEPGELTLDEIPFDLWLRDLLGPPAARSRREHGGGRRRHAGRGDVPPDRPGARPRHQQRGGTLPEYRRRGPGHAREAGVVVPGRRARDHDRLHRERRHQRADAGDQPEARLHTLLDDAQLGKSLTT